MSTSPLGCMRATSPDGEHDRREPALDERGTDDGGTGTQRVAVVDRDVVVPSVTGEDAAASDRLAERGLLEHQLRGLIHQPGGQQPDPAHDRLL